MSIGDHEIEEPQYNGCLHLERINGDYTYHRLFYCEECYTIIMEEEMRKSENYNYNDVDGRIWGK